MAKAAVAVPRRQPTADEQDSINRFKVEAMAACGAQPSAMAGILGMSKTEIERRYAKELKHGFDNLRLSLEVQIAMKARSGDARCLLAWLKQYGGWSEVSKRDTGENGGFTLGKLDNLSLDRLIIVLRQAEASPGGSQGSRGSEQTGGEGRFIDMEPISGSSDESSSEQG